MFCGTFLAEKLVHILDFNTANCPVWCRDLDLKKNRRADDNGVRKKMFENNMLTVL